jgi:hypothetical protein
MGRKATINPLNAELNAICHLLALLGSHHILHVSRIKVKRPFLREIRTGVRTFSYEPHENIIMGF